MPDERDEELIRTGRSKQRQKQKIRQDRRQKESEREKYTAPVRDDRIELDIDNEEPRVTRYYMQVSKKYRTAQRFSVVALVAFVIVMFIAFHDNITYANLLYLVRDLDSATEVNAGTYSDITYDSKYTTNISLFKNGIAVCGTSGFKLYSTAGSVEINSDLAYTKPHLSVGDKYALVFDAGSNDYALYTSLARVWKDTTEKVIEDGVVGDSGNFALLTRADDAKFLVTTYSDSFKAQTRYFIDKYVVSLALSPNGKEIAIASADSDGTNLSCEIVLGKIGTEDSRTISLPDELPIYASYSQNGTLVIVTDKSVSGIRGGNTVWSYAFQGLSANKFSLNNDIFTIAMSSNALGSENKILAFDMNGTELVSTTVAHKLSAVSSDGTNYVYVAGDGIATRIQIATGDYKEAEYTGDATWLLATGSGVMVCGSGSTTSLFLGS